MDVIEGILAIDKPPSVLIRRGKGKRKTFIEDFREKSAVILEGHFNSPSAILDCIRKIDNLGEYPYKAFKRVTLDRVSIGC